MNPAIRLPRPKEVEASRPDPQEVGPHMPRTMPSPAAPPVGGAIGMLDRCASALAIPAVAIVVALMADWDDPEFGRHPDEAGHFITGTLVHDWASSGFAGRPLQFGLRYYGSYPKIAFGHWPPLFYLIQGAWYGLFGVTRTSATLLTTAIASGFLLLLLGCLRRQVSAAAATAAVALVVASPVFRYSMSTFMADLIVAAFSLAACWSYVAYLSGGRLRSALAFGALSAMAISTKQDAIALGAVPPVSVLLLRRWHLLRDSHFYAPALIVAAPCLPYYVAFYHSNASGLVGLAATPPAEKLAFAAGGLGLGGWVGVALAVAGSVAVLRAASSSPRAADFAAVLWAHAIGFCAVQVATPVPTDTRYRASLLALAGYLAAMAFDTLPARWPSRARVAALATLVGLVIVDLPGEAARKVEGYRPLVAQLADRPGLDVVLVCSDTKGDGAIVSEFRLQHPAGKFCVLRADKVLADSTWMGGGYHLRVRSRDDLRRYLADQPVHYIVIDDWGPQSGPHARVLSGLIDAEPEAYPLVRSFPIRRRYPGGSQAGTARLYRVAANEHRHPRSVELHLPSLPGGGIIRLSASASASAGRAEGPAPGWRGASH